MSWSPHPVGVHNRQNFLASSRPSARQFTDVKNRAPRYTHQLLFFFASSTDADETQNGRLRSSSKVPNGEQPGASQIGSVVVPTREKSRAQQIRSSTAQQTSWQLRRRWAVIVAASRHAEKPFQKTVAACRSRAVRCARKIQWNHSARAGVAPTASRNRQMVAARHWDMLPRARRNRYTTEKRSSRGQLDADDASTPRRYCRPLAPAKTPAACSVFCFASGAGRRACMAMCYQ